MSLWAMSFLIRWIALRQTLWEEVGFAVGKWCNWWNEHDELGVTDSPSILELFIPIPVYHVQYCKLTKARASFYFFL